MNRLPLIVDCDPGVDDAVALFLAFASRAELDVVAITTVAGNVSAELTARNACRVRAIANREDVPVHIGAAGPLVRAPIRAAEFHGAEGWGGLQAFEPPKGADPIASVDAIIAIVMSRPVGAVTIAAMGPLTNLALALMKEPRLAQRLGPIVAMGGADKEGGNITPHAEFNIFADPDAAKIVIDSGVRMTVLGLDATHQVRLTAECRSAFHALTTPWGKTCAQLFDFMADAHLRHRGDDKAPLHDPCTIAYLVAPNLFETVPVAIHVDTQNGPRLGNTRLDYARSGFQPEPLSWVARADAHGVLQLLLERLAS